jgi:hypothetical protein
MYDRRLSRLLMPNKATSQSRRGEALTRQVSAQLNAALKRSRGLSALFVAFGSGGRVSLIR